MPTLPPGPRLPAAVQLAQWIVRPMEFLHECQSRYGDAFTLRLLNIGTIAMFTQPEAIKQIFTGDPDVLRAGEAQANLAPLVGSHSVLVLDGSAHLRERRLMMPPFHGERMQAYATMMRDIADASIDAWPVGTPFAMLKFTQHLTLQVILRALFGFEDGPELEHASRVVVHTVESAMSPFVLLPMFQRSFKGRTPWDRFKKTQAVSDEMVFSEIRKRRNAPDVDKRSDILSLLLQARHEDGSPMSDQELRDELITLVVAGHETSATALAWAFERLLLHPEKLERAREEVKSVVGDGPLEPAHLPKLEYIDAVLKETMRLRPILPIVVRKVHREVEIGGFTLPVGVSAAPCIYLAQRNPDVYPNPNAFEPERFLGAKADPYSWLPFGGGIRRCLGMAFANYEMKIVLAETLLRTHLRLVEERPARVTRRAITLVPRGGTRVVLERRDERRTASTVAPSESVGAST